MARKQSLRAFVTGVTGFAGSFLVESLLDDGYEVTGLVHAATSHQPLPQHDAFIPVVGDLLDLNSLASTVGETKPEIVFHLAGQASPGLSWNDPARTLAVNTGGTANILEAARTHGSPRVVVVTSAQMYEDLPESALPITEKTLPNPGHPYGVSKWAAGQLAKLYWHRYRLPVVEARPFNHIGPRQALGYVVPDFASQVAAIRLEKRASVMSVGNLSAERDFTDVRDVVRAYRLLAEQGRSGESYLICSGEAVSIREVLDTLIELAAVDVDIQIDPSKVRPVDQKCIVGSYAKLERDTGWRPEISLSKSLADSLEEWLIRQRDE